MIKGRVKSTTGLNLREKPNGPRSGVLPHNAEFDIIDQVAFYRVRTKDGSVGYVHGDYVEKMPAIVSPALSGEEGGENVPAISAEFNLAIFTNPAFVGEEVRVDRDFVPVLEKVAAFADMSALKVWVTSSMRQLNEQVKGAIVRPATKSCHHIGHAIDMNLLHDGTLYNSKKLARRNHGALPENIKDFFALVRADETMRWGGDFTVQDPVHIDDDFYHRENLMYTSKLDSRIRQLNAG